MEKILLRFVLLWKELYVINVLSIKEKRKIEYIKLWKNVVYEIK